MPKMTNEAKEARAAYMRKWREKNKEKEQEYRRAYWERKALSNRAETGTDDEGGNNA